MRARTVASRRSRAEAKAESREALIRAGVELFAAEGLDRPSLDAICARAGYTRGAFYVHFEDRDAFLVAVMERVGREFLDAILAPAAGAPDLATAVRRFLAAVSRGEYPLMGRRRVRPHQLLDACARSRRIRTRYVALIDDSVARLSQLAAASQAHGAIRPDLDPDDLARLLLVLVVGVQTLADLDVELDASRLAALALRLVARSP